MKVDILPEFQNFLVSQRLVPKKNVPYYAYWVSKFIDFSNHSYDLPETMRVAKFKEILRNSKAVEEWQVEQALEAVKLYAENFSKQSTIVVSDIFFKDRLKDPNVLSIIEKMREAIRLKHYSFKTERSYIDWVKRFFSYLIGVGRYSLNKQLTSEDVKTFLSYLAIKQRVSSSTQNQAFNALLFLFREVLGIELKEMSNTVRAKRGPKLPVVLTVDEIHSLFECTEGQRLLLMQLLYGSGLRLMELVRLRIQDIDFDANQIFVRSAKGDKDRMTVLPQSIKEQLKLHLDKVKILYEKDVKAGYGEVYLPNALERKYPNAAKQWIWQYVFPSSRLSVDPRSGKVRRHHISEKSIQVTVANATRKSKIAKKITVHTLRHSFATHLLMNGVNIREIQDLLGHRHVETTMIYTHVLRNISNAPKSPLDSIYLNSKV